MDQLSFFYSESGDFGHCRIEYGKDQLDLVKGVVRSVVGALDPSFIMSYELMRNVLRGGQIYPAGQSFMLYLYPNNGILMISTSRDSCQESRSRLKEVVGRFCKQPKSTPIFV